jgi:hypothetical protein
LDTEVGSGPVEPTIQAAVALDPATALSTAPAVKPVPELIGHVLPPSVVSTTLPLLLTPQIVVGLTMEALVKLSVVFGLLDVQPLPLAPTPAVVVVNT